ncbi:uncharacterized protein [Apostichopus japonicus]|uniref:uncharacterized protein n=1 Tax=Stichopus japonicus TaxID=307972 RepID=UPI003AB532B5
MESFLSQTLLLLLVLTSVVLGCGPQGQSGNKKGDSDKAYFGANNVPPASHYNSKSKRALFDRLEDSIPDETFLALDENKDGFIDACEWSMAHFNNNGVREFVRLLDQADVDDNELLSMDEFIAIESSRLSKESPPSIASRKPSKYRHFVH